MQKNNFTQHFGKNFKAALETVESVQIADNNQLAALLNESNLLAKASALTKTTVARLLTDETVPPKTKEQLKKLVTKKDTLRLKIEKSL